MTVKIEVGRDEFMRISEGIKSLWSARKNGECLCCLGLGYVLVPDSVSIETCECPKGVALEKRQTDKAADLMRDAWRKTRSVG